MTERECLLECSSKFERRVYRACITNDRFKRRNWIVNIVPVLLNSYYLVMHSTYAHVQSEGNKGEV